MSTPAPLEPYRGTYGDPRPTRLDGFALPPSRMPARQGLRPLKAWRYIGAYGPDLMLCVGIARIGPVRQAFWAVWDRRRHRFHERTALGTGRVSMSAGNVRIRERDVQLELDFGETGGVETVCPSGSRYGWTRKQIVDVRARIMLDGEPYRWLGAAMVDDTAAYYQRHTHWRWSAGVGTAQDGRAVAWNLVEGVNDPPRNSERTVWIAGEPHEPGPSDFAADLSRVDDLAFHAEAERRREDNALLLRSSYRQPFGTFSGTLPGGLELAEGYGVMEDHDAWW